MEIHSGAMGGKNSNPEDQKPGNAPRATNGEDEDLVVSVDEEDEHGGHDEIAGDKGDGDEVARLEEELAQTKDRMLRTAAELENLRRRTEKERSDLLKYGHESVMRDLLAVLDSFDQAMVQPSEAEVSDNIEAHIKGVALVHEQLMQALRQHGLEVIDAEDQAFDPNLHQAIHRVESESVESEIVGQVFQKGYMLNGRLVRAAMVSVLVPKD